MNNMIEKIKEKFMNRQFMTFAIIGVMNTLLAQGLYIVFVMIGFTPTVASVVSDILPMIFSYVMNMKFTYRKPMSWKSAMAFPISYIPGIIINAIAVFVVVNVLHAPKIYAKAIAIPIAVPTNFLCMNVIVKKFSKNTTEEAA